MNRQDGNLLQQPTDLQKLANEIADRVNQDPVMGVLFLVDPARVLEDLGYRISNELRREVGRSMLGVSRIQMDAYDEIKQRVKRGEVVSGIRSVRLRPGQPHRVQPPPLTSTLGSSTPSEDVNPLGGYDVVMNIAENVVERIASLAYEDGVIPHRVLIPPEAHTLGEEFIIGRPKVVSFDTQFENGTLIQFPFALMKAGKPTSGEASVVGLVKTVEEAGKPKYLVVSLADIRSLSVAGEELDQTWRDIIKTLLQNWLGKIDGIPLSPLLGMVTAAAPAPVQKLGLEIDDFHLKVCNLPSPQAMDSLAVCINLQPNGGTGNLANVEPFLNEQWGVGVNERLLHQVFEKWWSSPEAAQFRRLNKGMLDNVKTLAKQGRFAEIFDPNGSVVITNIQFSLHQGYIDVKGFVTVEDEFLWIDVDCELTARVMLSLDLKTHKLVVTVTDIDFSVSCWSKFLMGLVGAFFGLIGGAIIGGVIGAVAGGIVGGTVGATIGVGVGAGVGLSMGTLLGGVISGAVLPALAEAVINNKLAELKPFEIIPVKFDWQIPGSDIVLKAGGRWMSIQPGEILLGGYLDMPPLSNPAIDLALLDVQSTKSDIIVPWVPEKGVPSMGNYLVTSCARFSVQSIVLLEKPLTYSWTFEDQPVAGDGEELIVTITPSIGFDLPFDVPNGDGRRISPQPYLRITKTIWVLGRDGTKGDPTIITTSIDSPVFTYTTASTLRVVATDVVGTKVETSTPLLVQVLGDNWADTLAVLWEKMKYQYEPVVLPNGFTKPNPPVVNIPALQGMSVLRGHTMVIESRLSYRWPSLAENIHGARVFDKLR